MTHLSIRRSTCSEARVRPLVQIIRMLRSAIRDEDRLDRLLEVLLRDENAVVRLEVESRSFEMARLTLQKPSTPSGSRAWLLH